MVISVGGAEIQRVEELQQRLPLAALKADPALVAAHADWLAPAFLDPQTETFPLVFQAWILRAGDLTVVVDPCNGNGRERPVFPFFHRLDTPFLERFEATGVRPQEVDVVFCTHLHCDHCGWNTQLRGGRWVPTFPHARYLFVRREVERWDPSRPGHRVIDYNVGVFEDSVAPILEAGLAELVEDHHSVDETLTIEPAYGHTGGHSTLRYAERGEELVFTGDAFHHPLQVLDPALHLEGCDDLDAAVATRRRLREDLARRGAVMLPAHFPAPHGGRVTRHGETFRFEPLGA